MVFEAKIKGKKVWSKEKGFDKKKVFDQTILIKQVWSTLICIGAPLVFIDVTNLFDYGSSKNDEADLLQNGPKIISVHAIFLSCLIIFDLTLITQKWTMISSILLKIILGSVGMNTLK